MKLIFNRIFMPFSIYSISFLISKLFIFLSALKLGLFSAILGFIGIILQMPTSIVDLFITQYNLDWIILIIGIFYSVYWIYDKF